MTLVKPCGAALATLAVSACASAPGPLPGSLDFMRLQQQRELARTCQLALVHEPPWKETYYAIGQELFVDARGYCEIQARRAVYGMAFTR